ncbi:hypothetical protein [Brevibacillus thermoruber]|uniref:hypothetical protein n=1 Tax=Brevibacillus thermoruber TaxID=33942 RepID=UPI000553793E|nr:hypothetical protein [Brevibacillus thermoruber]
MRKIIIARTGRHAGKFMNLIGREVDIVRTSRLGNYKGYLIDPVTGSRQRTLVTIYTNEV